MKITLVLCSLEKNKNNIEVNTPEILQILDQERNLIGTIVTPCEFFDERTIKINAMIKMKLNEISKKYDDKNSDIMSIVHASILPSILLSLHYFRGIRTSLKSYLTESFTFKVVDEKENNREPISLYGSGMSKLSTHFLRYILTNGLEAFWQYIEACLKHNKHCKQSKQSIALYKLFSNVSANNMGDSGQFTAISEVTSGCLVIGDGIRAAHHSVLTDPKFYTPWIKHEYVSSYLLCTEATPLSYSGKRTTSPLYSLLKQLEDGVSIARQIATCIRDIREEMIRLVQRLNIEVIVVTDVPPNVCLSTAIALSVAKQINLKVLIVSHSQGSVLCGNLSKMRVTRGFDLFNDLTYGKAHYFVPTSYKLDSMAKDLEHSFIDIKIVRDERLDCFQSYLNQNNKNTQTIKNSDKILFLSTEYYNYVSTIKYLKRIVQFSQKAIIECSKTNKYNQVILRFRGDAGLFIPRLLESTYGLTSAKANKLYLSRESNQINIELKRLKLHIGFDSKVTTHSLLSTYKSMSHLHIGISSSLIYESMSRMNNVVYLPTDTNDYLPDHRYIEEQPIIADNINNAMRYLISEDTLGIGPKGHLSGA